MKILLIQPPVRDFYHTEIRVQPIGLAYLAASLGSHGYEVDFEQVYEERFERAYGFYRPYLRSVIYRYLDCGILRNGFPGSDVENAAMNIYLLSPASADTSALPATKSEWSSLANGCAERF